MPSISTEHTQDQSQKQKQKQEKPLPHPAAKWGITPTEKTSYDSKDIPEDHPVHKIPLEKQEKMRAKGINPVLRAEMDEGRKGGGGFWSKVAQTAMGGGWVK